MLWVQSWNLLYSVFLAWRIQSSIWHLLPLSCCWKLSWFLSWNCPNPGFLVICLAYQAFFCAYIPTTPPLRQAKITVILSLVSITLLFLRYNCISLHQSSNFVWSLSNYTGSGPMLFDITACIFLFASAGAGAGAADISISVFLYLLEAFSMICKDPSCSDNASISFVLLELVLVPFHSLYYMCFVQ